MRREDRFTAHLSWAWFVQCCSDTRSSSPSCLRRITRSCTASGAVTRPRGTRWRSRRIRASAWSGWCLRITERRTTIHSSSSSITTTCPSWSTATSAKRSNTYAATVAAAATRRTVSNQRVHCASNTASDALAFRVHSRLILWVTTVTSLAVASLIPFLLFLMIGLM